MADDVLEQAGEASAAERSSQPSRAPGAGRRLGERFAHAADTYAGVGGVLVVLIVFLSITQDRFFTYDNFLNIAETNAVLLVVSVGLTFVLLNGGIDLSVGGNAAFGAILLWELLREGVPAAVAIGIVIVAAGAIGTLVNGVLIGKVGLSFLVVTLGSGTVLRSISQVRTGGQSQSLLSENFLDDIGSGELFGVPVIVLISLSIAAVSILVLRYTAFGRMVYATGGNREAARLSGINVTAVSITVFGIAGLLAGVAAVLNTSQLLTASPTAVTGIELSAAAAVLLGGTSFMGGRGTVLGTVLGVLFLGVLSNGITLAGVSSFWQGIVSGSVLVAAVLLDRIRNGRPAT